MEKEKRVVIASLQRKRRRIREKNHEQEEVLYDVVEEILLRLPVKSLIRFKSVSKLWRWTIESLSFAERHLKMAERSYGDHPEVLAVSIERHSLESLDFGFSTTFLDSAYSLQTLNHLEFRQGNISSQASDSCDGLVCFHVSKEPFICVVNPATRWIRHLPPARFQILMEKAVYKTLMDVKPVTRLAFVKAAPWDYKLVWLYNSDSYNSDASSPNEGVTKCEVFDFRANTWRYLNCTPSYQIFDDQRPAYVNGTVYWLTERQNGETKVIAFDVQTETFHMMPCKNPVADSHPDHIEMCSLNNRLCMSKRKRHKMIQEIWILQSSSENVWEKIYTIDLRSCLTWSKHGIGLSWTRKGLVRPSKPVVIFKNNKILLSHRYSEGLVLYDPQTNSYSLFPQHNYCGKIVSYFQSLISHI